MIDTAILDDVHRFWFGELSPDQPPGKEQMDRWFRPSTEADAHIRDTYGRYLDEAAAQVWNLDDLSLGQQAALVVLLDQFPRQIYREDGRAFANDAAARRIAKAIIDEGLTRFQPAERTFILLPLEHSEDIADQDYGILLHAAETVAAPPQRKEWMRNALDFATRHRDIIRKFGRFPHRNAMIGRESTPDETEFLKGGRGY